MQDMPGTDEIIQQMLESLPPEQRLAGLDPAQRLASVDPAQRLAGLAPEQQVLALSDVVLRGLSVEYLRSLPLDVQEAIRRRIGPPTAP